MLLILLVCSTNSRNRNLDAGFESASRIWLEADFQILEADFQILEADFRILEADSKPASRLREREFVLQTNKINNT